MIYEIFTNPLLNTIVLTFLFLIMLLFLSTVGYLILYFINANYTTPILNGRGVIIDKIYEVITDNTTVTNLPSIVNIGELCTLKINIDGKIDEISVGIEEFKKYKIGDVVNVEYVIGKLWKAIFIKRILN